MENVGFQAEYFKWSINLKGRSAVSVQISTKSVYADFPERAIAADVHGILMRVASFEDTLRGKILAWQDSERRPSKRQKDLLDITRLVEAHPEAMPPSVGYCGARAPTVMRFRMPTKNPGPLRSRVFVFTNSIRI